MRDSSRRCYSAGSLCRCAEQQVIEGDFAAYDEDKKRRLGADSLVPHRIKLQKFAR